MRAANRILTVIALAAVALLPVGARAAHSRTITQAYDVGAGDELVLCASSNGGSCFIVLSTERSATFTVADDVSPFPVGFEIQFQDENGTPIGATVAGCGSKASIQIPTGTTAIVVYVDGPVFGPKDCIVDSQQTSPGAGTSGHITATFVAP